MRKRYKLQECDPSVEKHKWRTIAERMTETNAYWLCAQAEDSGIGLLYRVEREDS